MELVQKKNNPIEQAQREKEIVEKSIEYFRMAKKAKENAFSIPPDTMLDFYLGKQLSHRPKETNIILNHITTVIDSSISLIMQTPLKIELIPEIYQLQKAIDYYYLDYLQMQEKLQELLLFLKIWGTAFLYPHYEKENDLVKLKVDVLSREIYPDPSAKTIEDAEFVFYQAPIPLIKLQRWFPNRGKLVKEEVVLPQEERVGNRGYAEIIYDGKTLVSPFVGVTATAEREILPSANLIFGFIRDDTQQEIRVYGYTCVCEKCFARFYIESATRTIRCVRCHWPIPDKTLIQDNLVIKKVLPRYPRGRMVAIANDILLCDEPNPYYEFPFIKFINRDTTKFWGLGEVEYLLGEQIAINKTIKYIMEILKNAAKRPLIGTEGVISNPKFKVTDLGDLIEIQPGGDLHWMDMPQVPFDVFNFLNILRGQIDNKTGLRDRLGIKTATEAGFLEEEEQRRQLFLLTNIEGKLKKVVLHVLHILTNYHTQIEQVAWDAKKQEYVFFKGIDYRNMLFDVKVKFQTEKVMSKIVRHNQALQTLQALQALASVQAQLGVMLIDHQKIRLMADDLLKDLGLVK